MLTGLQSPLEFMLRVQQYVELVRAENISEAIFYARKHIMPSKEKYPEIVKHVPALLAYKPEMYSGSGPHMVYPIPPFLPSQPFLPTPLSISTLLHRKVESRSFRIRG